MKICKVLAKLRRRTRETTKKWQKWRKLPQNAVIKFQGFYEVAPGNFQKENGPKGFWVWHHWLNETEECNGLYWMFAQTCSSHLKVLHSWWTSFTAHRWAFPSSLVSLAPFLDTIFISRVNAKVCWLNLLPAHLFERNERNKTEFSHGMKVV